LPMKTAVGSVGTVHSDQDKIDPALNERLDGSIDDEIPVIVILEGEETPNLDGLDGLEVKYSYQLINGLAGEATPLAINRLAEDDSVKGVYLDGSAHVEAPEASTPGSKYESPSVSIKADKLWEKGIDGKGVTVAVIDSGIDRNHPDLIDKVIGEKNFLKDDATADDLLGHGTMVAGIIAGSGAASGGKYKGIAPGASLLSVKVIDSNGNGKVSDIIAGIEWAMYNGADVLSLSLGGLNLGETNPPITMAADKAMDAGAVVFVAAGNRNNSKLDSFTGASTMDAADMDTVDMDTVDMEAAGNIDLVDLSQTDDQDDKDVLLLLVPILLALPPGLIDSPGDGVKVVTVGASDSDGRVAAFSGSGPTRDGRTKPDIVGPGVDVISTVPPGLEKPDYVDVYYARESGTSLSTPVAAGLAALLLQADTNLTPAGVKAAMTRGAHKLNNSLGAEYEDYYQGAGHLDANQSYQSLGPDLVGVMPDRWVAGRWAYLPAGKGLYVGLDAGADRPQKKLYALAPDDEDWTTNFVFFTDKERNNLEVSVSGAVADWITVQPLPRHIPANSQKPFGASVAVPEGTASGVYTGSVEILEQGESIFTLPVTVEVAEPLVVEKGQGSQESALQGREWDYYYLDVPLGTSEINARLSWKGNSSLHLFLLSPTSEYYSGKKKGHIEDASLENPPSGRWLLAVHSETASLVNYTLEVERSLVESTPQRWILNEAAPGARTQAQFVVENDGLALENLSYRGVIENITTRNLKGSVEYKEVWENYIDVQPGTRRLSASLITEDESNQSEILFLFESAEGEPADADLGSGDLGPLEVVNPEAGLWKIRVYGYEVPDETEEISFSIELLQYAEEPWTWITTSGPKRIESESNGTLEASIAIPKNASIHRLDGYIEVSSASQSFQIPVSVTVAGSFLEGLGSADVEDSNQDGYFDRLSLGFDVNVTMPGEYRLEGVLKDCAGNRIEWLDGFGDLNESGTITVNVNGSDIWKNGRCGPLKIESLILYDEREDLIDRYGESITVEMEPRQFQPPAAYFTGDFMNQTTASKIAVGVNLSVVKPGSYLISGRIVDDDGEEMGKDSIASTLQPGNYTRILDFNPTKFMMQRGSSKVHLVDLVLSMDGKELERMDEAWSSGEMSPEGFRAGLRASANLGNSSAAGAMRRENGTIVIS
ncbi:MAG TPA: S8 family serine peptidase, partial [Methanotrichaceae archaeon]|nr:S8 family serine peptidase [Methanotrichaceae archaeon]